LSGSLVQRSKLLPLSWRHTPTNLSIARTGLVTSVDSFDVTASSIFDFELLQARAEQIRKADKINFITDVFVTAK
jgi:hypothetical protein